MGKHAVKRKIIISYILIGGLFLVIFAGIVANAVLSNGRDEVQENLGKNNANLSAATNVLLDSVHISTYYEFSNNEDVLNALYATDLDSFDRQRVHEVLKRIVNASPILESVYVYNGHQDVIYSSVSTARSREDFYETNLFEDINSKRSSDSVFLARTIELTDYTFNYDPQVISFVFTGSNWVGEGTSMMVVNISQEKLNSIIHNNQGSTGEMKSLVIDNNGTVISFTDESLADGRLEQEAFIEIILNAGASKGSFRDDINGESHIISYTKAPKWGCIFISIASYDSLLVRVYEMLKILGVLTALFCTVSIVSALYFARSIYSPIGKLVQEVKGFDSLLGNRYSNEYDYVLYAIENMKEEIGNLEDEVHSHIPAVRNTLLKQLLNGKKVNPKMLKSNGIINGEGYYAVMVFRLDTAPDMAESAEFNELLQYRNKLIELMRRHLASDFRMDIVEDGLENIPVILYMDQDRISWLQELKDKISIVQDTFEKDCGLTFTTGIGNIAFHTRELRDSYLDALEVTNYRIIFGRNSIITNQNTRSAKQREYSYPHTIEKKLLDSLKLSQKEKLEELIQQFTEEVIVYEYNEILLSYSQLALVIVRTARQINYTGNKGLRINYIEMQSKLNSCISIEEIKKVILELMMEIIARHNTSSGSKNHAMIDRIKVFILENYEDEDLCIEAIAEKEKLSVNYIRSLFKTEEGVSLSDYINQVRFEKAKSLLVETKLSAKKISSMCGFASNDYFYYAFKKFTGQTPTQYRKSYA